MTVSGSGGVVGGQGQLLRNTCASSPLSLLPSPRRTRLLGICSYYSSGRPPAALRTQVKLSLTILLSADSSNVEPPPTLPDEQLSIDMPIQSLPNELLLHIISLLAVASAEDLETSYWNRTRLRDLRAATLVSRTWQRLAQPILWEEVRLLNNTQVSNFVAGTAATGLTTATLRLFEDDSHRLAALAVGSCAGLRKLELWDLWDVDVEILFSPALARESLHQSVLSRAHACPIIL